VRSERDCVDGVMRDAGAPTPEAGEVAFGVVPLVSGDTGECAAAAEKAGEYCGNVEPAPIPPKSGSIITSSCLSDSSHWSKSSPMTALSSYATCLRSRTRSVPAPNVGRMAVRPLQSETNHTHPELMNPSAAAEKLDLNCSSPPYWPRNVPNNGMDISCSCDLARVSESGFCVVQKSDRLICVTHWTYYGIKEEAVIQRLARIIERQSPRPIRSGVNHSLHHALVLQFCPYEPRETNEWIERWHIQSIHTLKIAYLVPPHSDGLISQFGNQRQLL
jgi:hypothetical protein